MKTVRGILALLVIVIAAMLSGCGVNQPVADGGTHTGNPDVSACASALSELSQELNEWHVHYYIGLDRLNPSVASPSATTPGIAKRLGAGDTTVVVDKIYYSDTTVIPDTGYSYDTTIVDSVLVNEYVRSDTVDTILGGDTIKYITNSLVRDSVYVLDTIITVDTLYLIDTLVQWVPRYVADTVYPGDTTYANDSAAPIAHVEKMGELTFSVASSPEYSSAVYEPTDGTVRYVFSDKDGNLTSRNADAENVVYYPGASEQLVSVSSTYTLDNGTTVVVEYTDADGDNLLYSAEAGAIPAALMTERQWSTGASQTIMSTFSSGADGVFSTTSNNRIETMNRWLMSGTDTVGSAVYYDDGTRDTLALIALAENPSDSIQREQTTYYSLRGTDEVSAVDDLLVRAAYSAWYRRGDVKRLNLTMTIDTPVTKGKTIGQVSFNAVIVMADGDTTTMLGTFDTVSGLEATYESNGEVKEVIVGPDGHVTFE